MEINDSNENNEVAINSIKHPKWLFLISVIYFAVSMILLFLDAVAFFLIIAILGLISMIMSWLGKGFWSSIWGAVKAIYNLGWDGVSALVNLFK